MINKQAWLRSPTVWIVALIVVLLLAVASANTAFTKENKRLLALCLQSGADPYKCEQDFAARQAQKNLTDAISVGSGMIGGAATVRSVP